MLRDASQRIWLVEATALVSRCDAPQHEGDSAPRIFGRGHGAYARSVGAKHQPVAVENDRWFGFPVSGLLFTGSGATPTCRAVSARSADAAKNGTARWARSHRAALAQHVERDAVALDRRRNPAIERDQQQDVANLVRRAAVGERAVDVNAKLVGAPD